MSSTSILGGCLLALAACRPVVTTAAPAPAHVPTCPERVAARRSAVRQAASPYVLDKHEIRKVIRGEYPAMERCFEAFVHRRPIGPLLLQITFSWRIQPHGVPTNVCLNAASSPEADQALVDCLGEVYASLRYRAVSEPSNVTYPVAFRGGGDDPPGRD